MNTTAITHLRPRQPIKHNWLHAAKKRHTLILTHSYGFFNEKVEKNRFMTLFRLFFFAYLVFQSLILAIDYEDDE